MSPAIRTDFEKDMLIKAIDAFGRKFIVISPEFKILAANQFSNKPHSSEIVGKKCFNILNNTSKPCDSCPAFESMETQKPAITHGRKTTIDLDKIPCIYAYPLLSEGNVSGVVMLDFDIPAFGGWEDGLHRPDAFLKNLILSAVDGIIASDMKGNIIIFNHSASEISGYTEQEALHHITIRDLYPDNGAKEIMRLLRSKAHGGKGKLISRKVNVIKKHEGIIPIRLNASIVYEGGREIATIGFFHDLREEIRIQNELEQTQIQLLQAEKMASQSRIRTIIESLPTGVVVTNENCHVILMNESFKNLLSLDSESTTGKPFHTYSKDEGLCNFVKSISSKNTSAKKINSYEFALSDNKYLLARGKAVWGVNREYLGAVTTIVDITAMKVMDRLKSEFVAKVSHELQSPLATIHQQLATVLGDMVSEESETGHYILERAKERTRGLISLIRDLLDLSRIEKGSSLFKPKKIHIEKILAQIIEAQKTTAAEKKQTLESEFHDSPLPLLEIDPLALESVFTNLITNAIHYTQEGGSIAVRVFIDEQAIVVQVKDNGFGIEKQHLHHIFERFYRVQNEKTMYISGTGLGLPIAKEILDAFGGSIDVDSTPGKGSTFSVRLPIK
jgi:two-component system, OmpR family, phosphate regulon sensor histidine kinase PhoR